MAELIVDNVVKEYDGVAAADHISLKMQKGLYGLLHPYENDLHRDCANVRGNLLSGGEYPGNGCEVSGQNRLSAAGVRLLSGFQRKELLAVHIRIKGPSEAGLRTENCGTAKVGWPDRMRFKKIEESFRRNEAACGNRSGHA